MARTRLIVMAADRLLGAVSTTSEAVEQIVSRWPGLEPQGMMLFEDPHGQDPKMIQVRWVIRGQGHHLGHIMVDRGSVDTVLAELRKGQLNG